MFAVAAKRIVSWPRIVTMLGALTAANIAQYESDHADPAGVSADPARRASYLSM